MNKYHFFILKWKMHSCSLKKPKTLTLFSNFQKCRTLQFVMIIFRSIKILLNLLFIKQYMIELNSFKITQHQVFPKVINFLNQPKQINHEKSSVFSITIVNWILQKLIYWASDSKDLIPESVIDSTCCKNGSNDSIWNSYFSMTAVY